MNSLKNIFNDYWSGGKNTFEHKYMQGQGRSDHFPDGIEGTQ